MGSRAHLIVFFLIVLALSAWHRFDGGNDNCTSRGFMVQAIVQNGNLIIDPWHGMTGDKSLIDGHYYSDKAPLPALLVTPFWWAAVKSGWKSSPPEGERSYDLLRIAGFLCGSVPFAIIITLLWWKLRRSSSVLPPTLLAAVPLFGSFLFVFSGSFFAHLLGAALVLGCWIAVERERPFIAGALGAAAVLCEYPLVIFPAFWGLQWMMQRRWIDLARMFTGTLPFIVLLGAYNFMLTGSMFSIGYDHEAQYAFMDQAYGFSLPSLRAIWGLTFSDYRGLFFYMPVLMLALAAWIASGDRPAWFKDPIIVPSILFFVVICSYGMWWGGWTYGPRHLTAVAVLLAWRCWPAMAGTTWARRPFVLLGAFGLLCAFAAKSTAWFGLPTDHAHPMISIVGEHLSQGMFTDQHWLHGSGVSNATAAAIFPVAFVLGIGVLVVLDRRASHG